MFIYRCYCLTSSNRDSYLVVSIHTSIKFGLFASIISVRLICQLRDLLSATVGGIFVSEYYLLLLLEAT
jgi:hypothetical protein